jgi:ABC-type antimicrobial peptide transport system permease subunit
MFSVQLEKSLKESKIINSERTLVFYTKEYKFNNEDIKSIYNDNINSIDYIVPVQVDFQNIIIDKAFNNPLVLQTNTNFLKSNNLLLNKDIEFDKAVNREYVIIGKDLQQKNNRNILMENGEHKIDAITYNYLYSGYVINIVNDIKANRLEIVLNNIDKNSQAKIINYMQNTYDIEMGYLPMDKVKSTISYYDGYIENAIKVTIIIGLFSVINILSILIMKFDQEKRAIAVRLALGAREHNFIIQKFIELFILFSLGSLAAIVMLPTIIDIINLNLSFISIYFDMKVAWLSMLINLALALGISLLFSIKLNYKKIIVNLKG